MSELGLTLPARRREEMPLTVVSEGDVFLGRLQMTGNGQVMGTLEGQLSCPGELLIGPEARVRADLEAGSLVLAGHVVGNIVIQGRLKITSTGRLDGDAQVGSLVVQEGGVHFGLLHVYPGGLPEGAPADGMAHTPALPHPQEAGGRPLAGTLERVKKMWTEIF